MAVSNGHQPIDLVSAALGSPGASILPGEVGADAQADLDQALIRSTVQVNAAGLRELMFIRLYAGEAGVQFVEQLLRDKNHQNPGAHNRLLCSRTTIE